MAEEYKTEEELIAEQEEFEEDEFDKVYDDPIGKLQKILDMTGWTQTKVAGILHVKQGQISNYLNGKSQMSYHIEQAVEMLYSRVNGRGLKVIGLTEKGKVTLEILSAGVVSNSAGLTSEQGDAVRKATLYADPINGGNWGKAEKILIDAGLEVLYE